MAQIEDVRLEYEQISPGFRFISAIRLGVLTFLAGLVSWVASFIFEVYREPYDPLRMAIPLSGIAGVGLISYLEQRLIALYDILLNRGVELEEALNISHGAYRRIHDLTGGPRLRSATDFALVFLAVVFSTIFIIDVVIYLTR